MNLHVFSPSLLKNGGVIITDFKNLKKGENDKKSAPSEVVKKLVGRGEVLGETEALHKRLGRTNTYLWRKWKKPDPGW
jgi:hypothetical protein